MTTPNDAGRDFGSSDCSSSRCPMCESSSIGGLMESFWVPLNSSGDPVGEWNDWSGETELGEKRMCYDCEHEFEI